MDPSATIYTKLMLRLYDLIVLVLSNALAWRCSTRGTLLPFYQQHIGESAHLEIGVGTGYYPAASRARLAKLKTLTFLDLNPNTLAHAQCRLASGGFRGPQVAAVEQSVFDPLPADMRAKYDSVALFYLFHCLPGAFPKKGAYVFARVAPVLAPGGVVFGSTILGQGVEHNWLGGRLMKWHNGTGVFSNSEDGEKGLREALEDAFEEYEVRVVGVVALFSARGPRNLRP